MDNLTFRTGRAADVANAQHVNLAAFAPIHESFAEILGTEINALVYPDWQASQRHDLDEAIAKPNCSWIVAELEHRIVGFVVVEFDRETEVGELQLIAVHPGLQGRGIGALLNEYALDRLRGEGMRLVTLGTGGDRTPRCGEAFVRARRVHRASARQVLPDSVTATLRSEFSSEVSTTTSSSPFGRTRHAKHVASLVGQPSRTWNCLPAILRTATALDGRR